MKEALCYEKLDNDKVRCALCRHRCVISPGMRGICRVRENREGVLISLVYGRIVAEHIDPVEKKPLFHFRPGSRTYSIATVGCNFHCLHCQNYSISQVAAETRVMPGIERSPAEIVRQAVAAGCSSISYTYTEPTIFFEFALDTARLAKEAGLANIFVTNGYITPEALQIIAPYLDAANIDLKAFSDRFYREVAGARLAGVLDTIRDYRRHDIWIELTTLLIPGHNDDDGELAEMARFISGEVGVHTPWHLSRFFPTYKLNDRPPTPVDTLLRAAEAGRKEGLNYIYLGNTTEHAGEDTNCPGCGQLLIQRSGFAVRENRLVSRNCPECGALVEGVWQ